MTPCAAGTAIWMGRGISRWTSVCGLCVLLFASNVRAEEPLYYRASQGALVIGNAMDLGATMDCRGAKRCHEANPALARFKNPVTFSAAKTVGTVGMLWLTDKIPNRKVAAIANFAGAAFFGGLGIRNERIGR